MPVNRADLTAVLKKAETSEPPPWSFKSSDPASTQTILIEAAAESALQFFVFLHGSNFAEDPTAFMKEYRAETYDLVNEGDWTPCRRWTLLWACICDFSKRLQAQMLDETSDQRYSFEKPGGMRCIFYYNGDQVLRYVEAPLESALRKSAVADQFSMPASSCSDKKQKSAPVSGALSDADLKELTRMTELMGVRLDFSGAAGEATASPADTAAKAAAAKKKKAAKFKKEKERRALKKQAEAALQAEEGSSGLEAGNTSCECAAAWVCCSQETTPGSALCRECNELTGDPPRHRCYCMCIGCSFGRQDGADFEELHDSSSDNEGLDFGCDGPCTSWCRCATVPPTVLNATESEPKGPLCPLSGQ